MPSLRSIIALALAAVLPVLPVLAAEEQSAQPATEPAAAVQQEQKPEGGFEGYMEKHGERLEKEMENVMKPFDKGLQGIKGDTPQGGDGGAGEKK